MLIFDIFRINQIKENLKQTQEERNSLKRERDALRKLLPDTELYCKLRDTITVLEKRKTEIAQQVKIYEEVFTKKQRELQFSYELQEQELKKQIFDLDKQFADKKEELIQLDDTILLQSFGFYKPKYGFENSEIYKIKLDQIRKQQETLVKNGKAVYCTTNWSVNSSEKEGRQMIKDYEKLILRSFNNECDASIINVKFNNVDSISKKINKAFEILNKLGQRMNIVLSADYLNFKISELYLFYEYQCKKLDEKEEQRRIREQMREDAKVQKEIEEMKAKIEKEEKHFNNALQLIHNQIEKASTETERELLSNELNGIKAKLLEVEKNKKDIQYREQNTRAGYVYIISNIGSFGENIYKIGVTRRLNPQERVDELGDASVPFYFDVHAMIFSDDAPSLENALHKAFDERRLNRINLRREFFRVNLEEIETVVKNNFNKSVEFTKIAEAEQYRQSLILKGKTN